MWDFLFISNILTITNNNVNIQCSVHYIIFLVKKCPQRRGLKEGLRMKIDEFLKFKNFMTTQEGLTLMVHESVRGAIEKSYTELFESLEINDADVAVEKAYIVVNKVLRTMSAVTNFDTIDPGHGIGHLSRDYLHATLLSKEVAMDPRHLYVGMVAGILHDVLGCSIVDRYDDKHRVLKHAEVGALLWSKLSSEMKIDPIERSLIYYSIAAHTHLLKETKVTCVDGVERVVKPYVDEDENGPRLMFWLPRWIDRLDANGPCFIGRHYLTLTRDHFDLDHGGGYYKMRFEAHMRPLLRVEDEIKADPEGRTLREHLMMFVNSQNDASPYGKYDGEIMRQLRDGYKSRLLRIIKSFDDSFSGSSAVNEKTLERWSAWLSTKVEPSASGVSAMKTLKERFNALPQEIRKPWLNVMATTLKEYEEWRNDAWMLLLQFPEKFLCTPLIGDIRSRL